MIEGNLDNIQMNKQYKNKSFINLMTTDNFNRFITIQRTRGDNTAEYRDKQYPRGFTMNDKKIADSRYSGRLPLLTRKIIILFFSIIILLLMFAKINNINKTYTTGFFTIVLFFLMMIPIFYDVKKFYYVVLLYIIILTLLGTMGYGWGILGVIINLNPLKPKSNTNEK